MLIVDAHEDLAYNMLTYGRDYTRSAAETRRHEIGTIQPKIKEDTLLGWPDYQRGTVAVVFATLFATPARLRSGDWDHVCYFDNSQARRLYRQQLDLYHRLAGEQPDKFHLVQTQKDLHTILSSWDLENGRRENLSPSVQPSPVDYFPVGLVILMEGAECMLALNDLEEWWAGGVRIIGPAWAGNQFCGGTREPGGLTPLGFELLEQMASLGFCLDLSHMDEAAVMQALDVYPGTIIASHSNVRPLLKGIDGNRHLTEPMIQGILERDGMIGILPFNGFLQPGWKSGDRRDLVTLQHVFSHIDIICQMAGDALHVGIGSDFDGGFGLQSVPAEIDTIADLQKLTPLLAERGYAEEDISAILGGNWLNRLKRFLPEAP